MKDQVIELLSRMGGYRPSPELLHVADVEFDFSAALIGPPSHPGLVVLLDEPEVSVGAVIRRLRAFSTVLARSGKRRPITAILLNPEMSPASLEALREVSRVLLVDD